MDSAFNSLVANLVQLNLASIGTQQTVSDSNTMLTNANQKLCHAWTSCDESNPNDPGYAAWYYVGCVNNGGTYPPSFPDGQIAPVPTASQLPKNFVAPTSWNMTNWTSMFLTNSEYKLSHLSSTFITAAYTILENHAPPGGKGAENACLTTLSSVTNLLQAEAQSNEQVGQNGITLLNNIAQHFESDQGPLSSATSTILECANNYSSAISQISA